MKKLRGFAIGLMVLVVIFSNIGYDTNTFAEGGSGGGNGPGGGTGDGGGTSSGPKDVTANIVLGAVDLQKYDGGSFVTFVENGEYKADENGKIGNKEINPGNRLRLTYRWEVPQDKMTLNGEAFKAEDYFYINLPDSEYIIGKLEGEQHFKDKNGKSYGTYSVEKINNGTKDSYRIKAVFNKNVEEVGALEDGFFQVDSYVGKKAGSFKILDTYQFQVIVRFPEYKPWGPGPFSKNGTSDTKDGKGIVKWNLVAGFDNLKILMENKSGHNTTAKEIMRREGFYVYDELPAGVKVHEKDGKHLIQLKIPLYAPTDAGTIGGASITGGQLTYQANAGSIMYQIPRRYQVLQQGGQSFEEFKTAVNDAVENDSDKHPHYGIYEYRDQEGDFRQSIVVALGDIPSSWTYDAYYTKRTSTQPKNTLKEHLESAKEEGKITDTQLSTMLKTYAPDGGQSIVAWVVEVETLVDPELHKIYRNRGLVYIKDYEKPKDLEDSESVEYARITGGVEGVRTITLAVNKVWAEGSTSKPSVTVTLLANNKATSSRLTLRSDNHWQDSFANLPEKDKNGQDIVYTVKEDTVFGYKSTVEKIIDQGKLIGFTITNTPTSDLQQTMQITVQKKWTEPPKPQSNTATFKLYSYKGELKNPSEKTEVAEVTLVEHKNWTHTFVNLPQKTGLKYVVEEVDIPGYQSTHKINNDDSNHPVYVFTNTPDEKKKIDVLVKKEWGTGTPQLEKITVRLKQNGKFMGAADLKREDDYTYTFKNLAKGPTYTVEEIHSEGFYVEYRQKTDSDGNVEIIVTNTSSVLPVTLKIDKKWFGQKKEQALFTIYRQVGDATKQEVQKVTLNATNSWSTTIENLARYEGGKAIDYSIEEAEISGYKTVITEEPDNTFHVVNTELADYTVKKVWKDSNGNALSDEEVKDLSATVQLKKRGSNEVLKTVTLNKSNNWTAELKSVEKADENGEITYEINEIQVSGFEKGEVAFDSATLTFTVTNKKTANPPQLSDNSGAENTTVNTTEERTERERTTTKASTTSATTTSASTSTSTSTSASAAVSSTDADASESTTSESTAASTAEITTEATAAPVIPVSSAEIVVSPVVTTTAAPTPAPTTRTFEFIEIDEEIPLGVRTTAPLDLELFLIEESIPLGGVPTGGFPFGGGGQGYSGTSLPYTGFVSMELFIGMGILIMAIGAVFTKRMM